MTRNAPILETRCNKVKILLQGFGWVCGIVGRKVCPENTGRAVDKLSLL